MTRTVTALSILPMLMLQVGCAATFEERVARFVAESVAREDAETASRALAVRVYAASSVASLNAAGIAAAVPTSSLRDRHDMVAGSNDCVPKNAKAALVRENDGMMRITRSPIPLSIECNLAPTKDAASLMSLSRL
jgi:hypothetical protein